MGLKKVKLLRCVNIITMRLESHRLNYLSVVSRTNRPCVRRGARTLNRRSTIVEPNGRAASSRERHVDVLIATSGRPSARYRWCVASRPRAGSRRWTVGRAARGPRRRRLIVAADERVGGDARARRWRVASVDRTRFFIVGIVARGFTVGARASRARGDTGGDWMMTDAIVGGYGRSEKRVCRGRIVRLRLPGVIRCNRRRLYHKH